MDFLKSVDTWFLIGAVALLGLFAVWALKYILASTIGGLKESVAKLDASVQKSGEKMEKLIDELFNHRNDHEKRIAVLETRCDIQHGEESYQTKRQSGGRRMYDPLHPPEVEL